jgi:hypothetical protein
MSAALRGNLAAAAYQLGENRFAESLLNASSAALKIGPSQYFIAQLLADSMPI